MTGNQLWAWLITTLIISVGAMVTGVIIANQALTILAGAMFGTVATIVGWRFARDTGGSTGDIKPDAIAVQFARLMAVNWAWAGLAMLGCYYLTDLSWQHAWQYGAGMLLIAGLIVIYGRARLSVGSRFASAEMVARARWITLLQGVGALVGVVILAQSGKLDASRQDWAANVVFVVGGLSIFALSWAALRAERRAAARLSDA